MFYSNQIVNEILINCKDTFTMIIYIKFSCLYKKVLIFYLFLSKKHKFSNFLEKIIVLLKFIPILW